MGSSLRLSPSRTFQKPAEAQFRDSTAIGRGSKLERAEATDVVGLEGANLQLSTSDGCQGDGQPA